MSVRFAPRLARRFVKHPVPKIGKRPTVMTRPLFERRTPRKLTAPLGEIDPVVRRANVLLSGIELERSRGRVLQLGDAVLRINGETRPCRALDFVVPGLVRASDGLVRLAPHLGWRDADVATPLAEQLRMPVAVDNDASLGARAEHIFGAAREHSDVVWNCV